MMKETAYESCSNKRKPAKYGDLLPTISNMTAKVYAATSPRQRDTGSSELGKQVPQRWGSRFLNVGEAASSTLGKQVPQRWGNRFRKLRRHGLAAYTHFAKSGKKM
jgi:hypothetical protein